jgi:hypothetical protein
LDIQVKYDVVHHLVHDKLKAKLNKKQGWREQGEGSREQGAGGMLLRPCCVAKRNMGHSPSLLWVACIQVG